MRTFKSRFTSETIVNILLCPECRCRYSYYAHPIISRFFLQAFAPFCPLAFFSNLFLALSVCIQDRLYTHNGNPPFLAERKRLMSQQHAQFEEEFRDGPQPHSSYQDGYAEQPSAAY